MARDRAKCDQWRSGTCGVLAESYGSVTYCPRARAENNPPGSCCHHPLFLIRPRLLEMKAAGVNLARYRGKLRDVEFVERLYSAFLKAQRKKLAKASSTTQSIS